MAQAPQQPGGDANFVRQVVSDPKNVPDVMLLNGYPGASSEEGHDRLYLSLDLSSYVEIPKAAILHQAPLPKEQDANGGVTLWVKKDAALQYKLAPAAQALANYFAGAIQAGAQGAAAYGAAGGIQPTPTAIPTHFTPCIPTRFQPQCPYPSEICTHVGACPTRHPGYCPLPEAGAQAQAFDMAARAFCAGAISQMVRQTIPWNVCHGQGPVAADPVANVAGYPLPTHNVLCFPTRFQPQCPYPSEICTHVGACPTRHPGYCPLPEDVAAAGTAPQAAYAQALRGNSIGCPTFLGCPVPVSHGILCHPTNPVICPAFASGPACPQVSLACPQQSVACGGFPGQGVGAPVAQMQAFDARVGAVQATIDISYAPGCWYSYDACPSMICRPHGTFNTPWCPW